MQISISSLVKTVTQIFEIYRNLIRLDLTALAKHRISIFFFTNLDLY